MLMLILPMWSRQYTNMVCFETINGFPGRQIGEKMNFLDRKPTWKGQKCDAHWFVTLQRAWNILKHAIHLLVIHEFTSWEQQLYKQTNWLRKCYVAVKMYSFKFGWCLIQILNIMIIISYMFHRPIVWAPCQFVAYMATYGTLCFSIFSFLCSLLGWKQINEMKWNNSSISRP